MLDYCCSASNFYFKQQQSVIFVSRLFKLLTMSSFTVHYYEMNDSKFTCLLVLTELLFQFALFF